MAQGPARSPGIDFGFNSACVTQGIPSWMKQKQNELGVLSFSQTFGLTWNHFSLITQAQNFWKLSHSTTSAALSLSSVVVRCPRNKDQSGHGLLF